MDMELAKTIEISGDVQGVIEQVRGALQKEGFGIISYVNVSEKILEKTGNVMLPYIILGACNPNLSFEAIQSDDRIGLLLPCNVVVAQISDKKCKVIVANPIPLLGMDPFQDDPVIQTVAQKAYDGLMAAIKTLLA
jgi:uncharacterized protein (DUF302 family)